MKQLVALLIFLGALITSCGTQGVLHEYRNTKIIFGSGGGFTGQVNEYHLDAQGNLKMTESLSGTETKLGKVKKGDLKRIFNALSEANLSEIDFHHPGNMSYFIREVDKTTTHEVIWGNPDLQVPEEVQKLYNLLVSTINKN